MIVEGDLLRERSVRPIGTLEALAHLVMVNISGAVEGSLASTPAQDEPNQTNEGPERGIQPMADRRQGSPG
jgi:hypothetical protein